MPTIRFPQNKDLATGTIRKWRKKAGEPVSQGEVIVEIEGETALVQIESTVSGPLVEIFAKDGQTVSANAPLAW